MTILMNYLEHFTYAGIFLALVVAGLGVPVPEDATLITSGYLVYLGVVRLWIDIPVCILGVLAGDSLIFYVGRRWGRDVVHRPWLGRLLHARRIERMERYFVRYGSKTIFIGRFLPGFRAAIHLTAGAMKMSYRGFILWDGISALVSVPIFVGLGLYFGPHIDRVIGYIRRGELGFGLVVLLVAGALLLFLILLERRREHREVKSP